MSAAIRTAAKDARETFKLLGAVCLRQVFEKQWVKTVQAGIQNNIQHPGQFSEYLKGDKGEGTYFSDYMNWRKNDDMKKFLMESPAAEIAGHLMDSKYAVLYHDHVLVKDANCHRVASWHHDQSYYPVDGTKVCSIWMPVDPIAKETCLKVVSGSHLWGKWFHPKQFGTSHKYPEDSKWKPDRTFDDVPDIDAEEDKHEILAWDMEPGDCIVFHMLALHMAPANLSKTSRRVLSSRWLGDDTVMARRPWTVTPPVLGGAKPGNSFKSEIFPVVWSRP